MTKDGIAEMAQKSLKAAYDKVAEEPVPQHMLELVAQLRMTRLSVPQRGGGKP